MKATEKKTVERFGKSYFLGQGSDGVNYFLRAASWDCDWYWGGGYVQTYTNNKSPEKSKDISSHQHFDCLFFRGNKNAFDLFKEMFAMNPYTDNEIWKICELMRAFYIAREYSDMLHRGGAHYTENPVKETIKNDAEYERINKVVIPAIMEELYKIMEA